MRVDDKSIKLDDRLYTTRLRKCSISSVIFYTVRKVNKLTAKKLAAHNSQLKTH